MLKWLHINRGSGCSGLLLCNHLDFPISIIPYLPLEYPSKIITRGGFGGTHIVSLFWEGSRFCKLPRKGSLILTILTRTNVADENLKVSTPTSDDFWMVPYPVYLFIAKLPVWFTWDKQTAMLSHFGVCLLD